MPQLPIPDDWDGETWGCYLIEWPKSVMWEGVLRGFVTTPLRGRFWDARSGSIIAVQSIGKAIEQRNNIMSCEAIVTALNEIRDEIADIKVSSSAQATLQLDISNNINLVATAISNVLAEQNQTLINVSIAQANAQATAFAWANAFAQQLAPTYVINNYEQTLRPIDPTILPAPTTEEVAKTGVTSTLDDQTDTEMCKRVFWLIWNVRTIFYYVKETSDFMSTGVLAILGGLSDAVAALGVGVLGQSTRRYLLPAAALLQLTHLLAELMSEGDFFDFLDQVDDAFTNNFDELFATIYCGAINENKTDVIQGLIRDFWTTYLTTGNGIATMTLLFNLSALATLYYEGTGLDPAPAVPSEFSSLCSEDCSEGG